MTILNQSTANRVCLNMIVRNESKVIERCLLSMLKFGITSYCIVDNGSTDNTVEIIKSVMGEVPGVVVGYGSDPIEDYSEARNFALMEARKISPGQWIFFMDAKSELEIPKGFRMGPLDLKLAGYMMWLWEGTSCFKRCNIINPRYPWHYIYPVHEELVLPDEVEACIGQFHQVKAPHIRIHSGEGWRGSDPDRFLKDAAILEKYLDDHPDDRAAHYKLGQSYRDAGNNEKTVYAFCEAKARSTNLEDRFDALKQILDIEKLGGFTPELLNGYVEAALVLPERSPEIFGPLAIVLIERGLLELAHFFILQTRGVSVPPDSRYCVDASWYTWRCLDILAHTSAKMGDYKLSFDCYTELLMRKSLPDRETAARNLEAVRTILEGNSNL
jgi:glycosyltransferase involved in cell wall biosynthesis